MYTLLKQHYLCAVTWGPEFSRAIFNQCDILLITNNAVMRVRCANKKSVRITYSLIFLRCRVSVPFHRVMLSQWFHAGANVCCLSQNRSGNVDVEMKHETIADNCGIRSTDSLLVGKTCRTNVGKYYFQRNIDVFLIWPFSYFSRVKNIKLFETGVAGLSNAWPVKMQWILE
jgi:hypothetical protein